MSLLNSSSPGPHCSGSSRRSSSRCRGPSGCSCPGSSSREWLSWTEEASSRNMKIFCYDSCVATLMLLFFLVIYSYSPKNDYFFIQMPFFERKTVDNTPCEVCGALGHWEGSNLCPLAPRPAVPETPKETASTVSTSGKT